MFERRLYTYIDWMLVASVGVLSVIGLVMIFSATYDPTTEQVGGQFYRQIGALLIGIVGLGVCLTIDYRVLMDRSLLVYAGLAALLAYTLFFGVEQGGSQRWIGLGPVTLQPSEFARIVIAIRPRRVLRAGASGSPTAQRLAVRRGVRRPAVRAHRARAGPGDRGDPAAGRRRHHGVCRAESPGAGGGGAAGAPRRPDGLGLRHGGLPENTHCQFPRSGARPRGAGTSRSRRGSRLGQVGSPDRDFCKARRASTTSFRSRTTFHLLGAARGAGIPRGAVHLGLYLFVILRSLDAARVAKDRAAHIRRRDHGRLAFQVIYNVTMFGGFWPR